MIDVIDNIIRPRIIVSECMRKRFKLPRTAVMIEQFALLPYNAIVIHDNGKKDFAFGLYYKALKHLEECQECRKVQYYDVPQLLSELKELEEFWKLVNSE